MKSAKEREAALAGLKEVCKATGGVDSADFRQKWKDWVEEHYNDAGMFRKKVSIGAGKAYCRRFL